MPSYHVSFENKYGQVHWKGKIFYEINEFDEFLKGSVIDRLNDISQKEEFEEELRALATTDMAQETLRKILSQPRDLEPWEIGESMAECLLEQTRGVQCPWNVDRDKKTPRASLPGADIIGFISQADEVYLALGETKTSFDKDAPPKVMTGRSGMIHQLDALAASLSIQIQILKWLNVRCKNTNFESLYEQAVGNYLKSGGRALVLFGVLMRDTVPSELDLKNRAFKLSQAVSEPTQVELIAWYLPRPIPDWSKILGGEQ